MATRQFSIACGFSLAALTAPVAQAADLGGPAEYSPDFSIAGPAVSAPNGKIGAIGGVIDDDEAYGIFGAFSLPLGHSVGLQVDGLFGEADGDTFYGAAGHVFWRDPAIGLLGLYASYVNWENAGGEVGKVGIEADAYLGRVSLEGLLAYQFGTEDGVAGKGTLAFYPIDDLRLDISVSHLEGVGFSAGAGVEWAPEAAGGLSFFADASIDEESDWRAFGGVSFYLGEQKSLIRRHREDDPEPELVDDLAKGEEEERQMCPDGWLWEPFKEICYNPEPT